MSDNMNEYILPSRARLVAGTRLLNPYSGTYFKYGGRWVHVMRWAENGKIIVSMMTDRRIWQAAFYLVDPEQIGLPKYVKPQQEALFK